MNANELANKLEKPMLDNPDCPNFSRTRGFMEQVVAMLRQQQAEIQALKQVIDANNLSQNIGQFVKPANEPVAWIGKDELQFGFTDTRVTNEKESWDDVPLYTHPVKEQDESFDRTASHMVGEYVSYPVKELTDEEIRHIQAICHLKDVGYDNFIMRFARAILRKAQEK